MNYMKISIVSGVIFGLLSGYFVFNTDDLDRVEQNLQAEQKSILPSTPLPIPTPSPTAPSLVPAANIEQERNEKTAAIEAVELIQAQNPGMYTVMTGDPAANSPEKLAPALAAFVEDNPMYFVGEKSALKNSEAYVEGVKALSETGEKNDWSSSYETGIYNETKLFSEFLTKQELSCNAKVCVLTGETTDKRNLAKIHDFLNVKDLWGYRMSAVRNESGAYTFFFVKHNFDNDVWPSK